MRFSSRFALFCPSPENYYATQLVRELQMPFMTHRPNLLRLCRAGVVERAFVRRTEKSTNPIDRRANHYRINHDLASRLLTKYRRHVSFGLYKLIPYESIDVPSLLESEAFTAECKRYEFDPHEAVEALCKNTRKIEVKQSMWADGPDKRFLIRKEQ